MSSGPFFPVSLYYKFVIGRSIVAQDSLAPLGPAFLLPGLFIGFAREIFCGLAPSDAWEVHLGSILIAEFLAHRKKFRPAKASPFAERPFCLRVLQCRYLIKLDHDLYKDQQCLAAALRCHFHLQRHG